MNKEDTFVVGSSHGEIEVDRETGETVSCNSNSSEGDLFISGIVRFDIQEWKSNYKKEIPDCIDILDLGYWYKDEIGPNNEIKTLYEPPVQEWRDEYRKLD